MVSIQSRASGTRQRIPSRSAGTATGVGGVHVPHPLPPVEREDVEARRLAELAVELAEHARGHDLLHLREIGGEVGCRHDGEPRDVGAEPPAVDDHRHVGAGPGLLDAFVVFAERESGEDDDIHLAVRPALDALLEGEQALEQGIVLGEGGADVELVGGGAGRRELGDGSDGA